MTNTLQVKAFDKSINIKDMPNMIKAVVYGPKFASTSIIIDEKEFSKLYKKIGESSVVSLKGLDQDIDTLIHDVQYDILKDKTVHADFYAIEKGKKVKVHIPLTFVGVAAAVKNHGADLIKVMHEVEVEAEAKDLPHDIQIDISTLINIDDHIKVSDIKTIKGVTFLAHEDDLIATVSKHEEETEEVSTIDMSAIEVSEKKGKKDEDAE